MSHLHRNRDNYRERIDPTPGFIDVWGDSNTGGNTSHSNNNNNNNAATTTPGYSQKYRTSMPTIPELSSPSNRRICSFVIFYIASSYYL